MSLRFFCNIQAEFAIIISGFWPTKDNILEISCGEKPKLYPLLFELSKTQPIRINIF